MKALALAAAAALLVAGCTTMNVTDSWKDPSFKGPPAQHVLVVGVARSSTTRRVFEDAFAAQLRAAGVEATSSYTKTGDDETESKIKDLVERSGADALLVTRLQRVQQKVNVTPGTAYTGGFWGWYGGAYASAPTVTQYDEVTLETTVWSAKTEKVVWAVTTKNIGTSDVEGKTRSLAQELIPKLKADGVIR